MVNSNNEPSNEKIDDYHGNESKRKRNIVRLVIIFCLIVGAFFTYLTTTAGPTDYVGTQEHPGINPVKR